MRFFLATSHNIIFPRGHSRLFDEQELLWRIKFHELAFELDIRQGTTKKRLFRLLQGKWTKIFIWRMEWELSKENVQPLKEGRNVEKLNAALKARTGGHVKAKISEQHRIQVQDLPPSLSRSLSQHWKMLESIDDYDGDDPIQPWLESIQWVKDAYPSGGSQSGMLRLLELCVRTFCRDERYCNDIRYLKVWIEYADRCKDPREIFYFLQDNDIGQNHALFYENCARFWEHQRRFSKANEIFQLGIARNAQPFERLQIAYRNFMKRSAREADDKIKDDISSYLEEEGQGRAFGTNLGGRLPGQTSQQTGTQKASDNQRASSGGLSVFVDPQFRSMSQCSGSFYESNSNQTRSRANFVIVSERSKENNQQRAKLANAKIPQKTVLPSAPTVQLDVFTDEQFSRINDMKEPKVNVKPAIPLCQRLRLDDVHDLKREADKLMHSPLIYFVEEGFQVPQPKDQNPPVL